jgi:hypothetical protein
MRRLGIWRLLRVRRLGRRASVVVRRNALLEVFETLAEALAQISQLARPENQESYEQDDEQLGAADTTHGFNSR